MMGDKQIMAAAGTGDPDDEGATYETARLRESIAETRESIGNTIDALQEKLNPSVLAGQAKTAVRDATIGKVEDMIHEAEEKITRTGHSFYDSVRRHPVPLAMAGIGVGWLIASYRRERRQLGERRVYRDERVTTRYRGDEDFRAAPSPALAGQEPRRGMEIGGEGNGHRGESMTGKIKRAAHEVAEKAEELTGEGTERVTEAAREARDTVKRVAHEATERGRRVEGDVERMFRDNPLAAGAIAMAAGTAVGLAIPISHKEEEWMGPARDRLLGKANELAHEALGKVEEGAQRIQEVAGRVEDMARDVGQSAGQARGEGGGTQQGVSRPLGPGR